ncbi:protein BIG GRAIN 1-like E [Vigna umbellata]|uniref:protein BIG GRAIN 1-like E n=1 Tax=Vigna umbellata TaxID=87088 RepID=UPI001F5F0363|nr:protein BIG GRAIN 1-like E [Vigna umbellata]XP_047154053.1 protein BIG GRAIN 1-like E [Vigna umbellata]
MSIAGLVDPEINHNKSFHRRNDSGELDVFEAARYFSGYSEVVGYTASTFTQKIMREERHHAHRARISLDMPMRSLLPQQFHGMEKQIMKEKKHKQPSSPGGRLASFLNSLFSQSASKKKKSKSSSQSMKDEDESPGGRRRRRSSISHFRSASTADSKSLYSSLSSGFRTPPYVQTPTKSCKEFRTFSDHKHAQLLSAKYNNGHARSTTTLQNELWDEKKKREPTTTLMDDNSHNHNHKHKHTNGLSSSEKQRNKGSHESVEKDRMLVEKYSAEEKEISQIRKFNEVDDGAESDSSSDLFELQNYDLGYYSSGLPVYETTNMDSIKRGAPISNGPL